MLGTPRLRTQGPVSTLLREPEVGMGDTVPQSTLLWASPTPDLLGGA